MNSGHLRVYYGPAEQSVPSETDSPRSRRQTCTVPLTEVLPLLGDAVNSQRTWIRDFEDDEITISMDLYEVLLAYKYYRPSA